MFIIAILGVLQVRVKYEGWEIYEHLKLLNLKVNCLYEKKYAEVF